MGGSAEPALDVFQSCDSACLSHVERQATYTTGVLDGVYLQLFVCS